MNYMTTVSDTLPLVAIPAGYFWASTFLIILLERHPTQSNAQITTISVGMLTQQQTPQEAILSQIATNCLVTKRTF